MRLCASGILRDFSHHAAFLKTPRPCPNCKEQGKRSSSSTRWVARLVPAKKCRVTYWTCPMKKHGWSIYWMFFPFEYGLLDHSPFFWDDLLKSSHSNGISQPWSWWPEGTPVTSAGFELDQLCWSRRHFFFPPPSPAPCCPNKPDDWCSGHCGSLIYLISIPGLTSGQSTRQYPSIENPLGFSMDTPPLSHLITYLKIGLICRNLVGSVVSWPQNPSPCGSPPADLRAVFQESEVLKTRKESYQEKLEEYNSRLKEAVNSCNTPMTPMQWWLNDDRHGEYIYEIYMKYMMIDHDEPWLFFCWLV